MIRRSWRYVLAFLVVLALILGGGYWYWNRPAPQPTLEQLPQADGTVLTRVTPGTAPKARVAVAVLADETLTDSQLIALSQGGAAQIVQVILPKDDCKLQEQSV
ncbi:virulence factor family protein, partial [Pseudomonas sp. K5002]|nr:virulence factor family protein [Pseudomonas sp. K5002]